MKDLSKKNVLIVYTGGTIGMKNTAEGYAPVGGYLLDELKKIDDLNRGGMPKWDFLELSPLLDSSNVSFIEWNNIAKIIVDNYANYDGFVILHGTDTMAYTSSALSFILHGLDKPVVLTGSQIPLSEIRSDARDNLISSIIIAGEGFVKEVCLCFGGKLLRGNRATKTSADRLVAFDSPNYPYLAEIGISVKYNPGAFGKFGGERLEYRPFSAVPIGVLKIFPGMQFGLFEDVISEKLSGVVLETFGTGNIPNSGDKLLPIIRKAFKQGAVVAVCSQCVAGSVVLGAYQTSSALKQAGAVSGKDMTTESAVAKLYHLFSMGYATDKIKALMEENIAGELTY